jgi:hypothetical protein
MAQFNQDRSPGGRIDKLAKGGPINQEHCLFSGMISIDFGYLLHNTCCNCELCRFQFVNFLDLANWRLSRAGFECVKLDGTMSPQQRDAAIK